MDDLRQELTASETEIDQVIVLMQRYGQSLQIDSSLLGDSIRSDNLLAYMGMIEQSVMETMFDLGMIN